MFQYPVAELKDFLSLIIEKNVSPEIMAWLKEQQTLPLGIAGFNKTFVLIPRRTGKAVIELNENEKPTLQKIRPGLSLNGYTIDRLCRVWLLLQLPFDNETNYLKTIETLFHAAEVNELVALYGALPLYAFPEKWAARCAEGIRSNIGDVLETIICDNPFPSEQLKDAAWNQLVLKGFFTEKDIQRIIGFDKRANKILSDTLIDYAHERWAASRTNHPQLWRGVSPFINEENFSSIERAVNSKDKKEQKAALLACYKSSFIKAKELVDNYPSIKQEIESGVLTWNSEELAKPSSI